MDGLFPMRRGYVEGYVTAWKRLGLGVEPTFSTLFQLSELWVTTSVCKEGCCLRALWLVLDQLLLLGAASSRFQPLSMRPPDRTGTGLGSAVEKSVPCVSLQARGFKAKCTGLHSDFAASCVYRSRGPVDVKPRESGVWEGFFGNVEGMTGCDGWETYRVA